MNSSASRASSTRPSIPAKPPTATSTAADKDIATGAAVDAGSEHRRLVSPTASVFGGVGGSMRVPIVKDKLVFGAKGLFGPGVGHFGDSTLSDATSNSLGQLVPIHNVSGLLTAGSQPQSAPEIYAYYGGDYAGREDEANSSATTLGIASARLLRHRRRRSSPAAPRRYRRPGRRRRQVGRALGTHRRRAQSVTARACCQLRLQRHHRSRLQRQLDRATIPAAPAARKPATCRKAPSATGTTSTRATAAVCVRASSTATRFAKAWSGASGIGAKGIENMIFTSLRYFLP